MKRYMLVLPVALLCVACSKKSPTAPDTTPDTTPKILSCTFTDSIWKGWDKWQVGGVWDSSRTVYYLCTIAAVVSNYQNVADSSDSASAYIHFSLSGNFITMPPTATGSRSDHPTIAGAKIVQFYSVGHTPATTDSLSSIDAVSCDISWWSGGQRYLHESIMP